LIISENKEWQADEADFAGLHSTNQLKPFLSALTVCHKNNHPTANPQLNWRLLTFAVFRKLT
jgi:hypothetical protein